MMRFEQGSGYRVGAPSICYRVSDVGQIEGTLGGRRLMLDPFEAEVSILPPEDGQPSQRHVVVTVRGTRIRRDGLRSRMQGALLFTSTPHWEDDQTIDAAPQWVRAVIEDAAELLVDGLEGFTELCENGDALAEHIDAEGIRLCAGCFGELLALAEQHPDEVAP